MPILGRLVDLYQSRGFAIATGLNPTHMNDYGGAPYTHLIKDGRNFTNGLGITAQEVYFIESLGAALTPRSAFVIGNSFGWSTFALALSCPKAKVVAIDAGFDVNSLDGLAFTQKVAGEEKLDVVAVKAASPQDVPTVIGRHCDRPLDFVFIDGLHTNEQVGLDFAAVRPHLADHALVLFHDVLDAGMLPGFQALAAGSGMTAVGPLMGTSSGMAALIKGPIEPPLKQVLDAFAPRPEAIEAVREEAWKARRPLLSKWQRSLAKRRATLRRWLGKA